MTSDIRTRSRRKPYGRRRPIPALLILLVLVAASIYVWVGVLRQADNTTAKAACRAGVNAPAGLPTLHPLPYTALNSVVPAPPGDVRVRALNASTQSGLADRVSTELKQLGFVPAGPADNDSRYPNGDMKCFGQIRFGPNGESAARTVSLVMPCAQLVQDNRQDASVDVALGSYFSDLVPTPAAQQVLAQLNAWAAHHPTANGGLQSQSGQQPSVSASLLAGAHTFSC
jgi:hypothetical protein